MHYSHLDAGSVQSTLLSILFLAIGTFFNAIDVLSILQGIAYILSIVIAFDTLSGNKIKKLISNKFKNESKSKGHRSDKKS